MRTVVLALAGVLATAGFLVPKWFGPLGFAGLSCLLILGLRMRWPQFALWSTVTLAYFNAAWIVFVVRQIVFELSTAGHLTTAFDSCTRAVLPYFVGFLFVVALFPNGLVTVLQRELSNVGSQRPGTPRSVAFNWPAWRIALALSIALGAASGAFSWHDAQIDQPCL